MTAAEMGKVFADGLRGDASSAVQQRRVILSSGIPAYEVRYDLHLDGRSFTGVAYALVRSSGSQGYIILYRAVDCTGGSHGPVPGLGPIH